MVTVEKRFKSVDEVVAWCNRHSISKRARIMAVGYNPPNMPLGPMRLVVGDSSYTDLTAIQIGVPKTAVGKTPAEVYVLIEFRVAHEQAHRWFTPDKEYKAIIEKFAKYFAKTYNVNKNLAAEAGSAMLNGICDGRIEVRMLCEFDQDRTHDVFRYGRSQWFLDNDMSKGPRANSHEPYDELFDGLFCLCTLATMGTFPIGWVDKWKNNGNLYQLMMGARQYVNAYVTSQTFDDAEKPFWALVNHLETWLADLLTKIPADDAQQAMQQAQSAMGGNAANNNNGTNSQTCPGNSGGQSGQSGQSGSQSSAGGQTGNQSQSGQTGGNSGGQKHGTINSKNGGGEEEKKSPMHEAFQNNNSGSQGNGGRITRVEDEYDGDYGTNMEKIVSDAMKTASAALKEEIEQTLIQAEFDDILFAEKEASKQGFDKKAADEVAAYYAKIDPKKRGGNNWAVSFTRHEPNLPKLHAPTSVKNTAKRLHTKFEKIFQSKKAMTLRNQRSGLLDTHALHRLIATNSSDIFTKNSMAKDTDFAFYILMDGSGSMSGRKFTEALRACSIIEESLRGLAPVKIVVFDYSGGVRHHIVKDFKEVPHNMSWAYANTCHAGGCNMDGYSIRVAKNELLKRNERHKILITLSDGQPYGPSSYSGTRGENDVNEAVRDARKQGLRVFNIFFAESANERKTYLPSFSHMYGGKGIISCDPANIGDELLRLVTLELK